MNPKNKIIYFIIFIPIFVSVALMVTVLYLQFKTQASQALMENPENDFGFIEYVLGSAKDSIFENFSLNEPEEIKIIELDNLEDV